MRSGTILLSLGEAVLGAVIGRIDGAFTRHKQGE